MSVGKDLKMIIMQLFGDSIMEVLLDYEYKIKY